jgi:glycosyltransferase involved in cell wall biosynthesis
VATSVEPVSVVVPTHNRADLLPLTLASVLAGIDTGDELIVVDDGSTDDTASVVQAADAPWHGRIRYLPRPWGGAGRAFNAGIIAASHDLVAFADSDDLWMPYRLSLSRPLLGTDRGLACCFTNFGQLMQDGSIEPHWLVKWSRDPRDWSEIIGPGYRYADRWPLPAGLPAADAGFKVHVGPMYLNQLRRNYMNVNTMLVRRSVVGDDLRFGEDLPRLADWELFARVARHGDCAYLDVDTALQRSHDGPRLSGGGPFKFAQSRMAIIERTWARDQAFMRDNGVEVEALLEKLRHTVVRHLIRMNRRDEARSLLPRMHGTWMERAALLLPHAFLMEVLRRLGRDKE